jgi:hypothetical protein
MSSSIRRLEYVRGTVARAAAHHTVPCASHTSQALLSLSSWPEAQAATSLAIASTGDGDQDALPACLQGSTAATLVPAWQRETTTTTTTTLKTTQSSLPTTTSRSRTRAARRRTTVAAARRSTPAPATWQDPGIRRAATHWPCCMRPDCPARPTCPR